MSTFEETVACYTVCFTFRTGILYDSREIKLSMIVLAKDENHAQFVASQLMENHFKTLISQHVECNELDDTYLHYEIDRDFWMMILKDLEENASDNELKSVLSRYFDSIRNSENGDEISLVDSVELFPDIKQILNIPQEKNDNYTFEALMAYAFHHNLIQPSVCEKLQLNKITYETAGHYD
jgi:hypothetical protein